MAKIDILIFRFFSIYPCSCCTTLRLRSEMNCICDELSKYEYSHTIHDKSTVYIPYLIEFNVLNLNMFKRIYEYYYICCFNNNISLALFISIPSIFLPLHLGIFSVIQRKANESEEFMKMTME